MSENLNQLYQDIILDHQKDPRNFGELKDATSRREGYNPLCGDRVQLALKCDKIEGKLCDIRFRGDGCSICMASASIMTEEVSGQDLGEVRRKIEHFRDLMKGQVDPDTIESDLGALAGVRHFPVRIKCALLPWMTLKEAVDEEGAS